MSPQKILQNVSYVELQKLSKALTYVEISVGPIRLREAALAWANQDFFDQLNITTPVVRVYVRRPSKIILNEYSYFYILRTNDHILKIDAKDEKPVLTECLGVSYEWFDKKGIKKDNAEACIEEMPHLTLKPL